MKLLITICARGGSKGLPKKNIKEVGGQPLIAYTIKTAFRLQSQLYEEEVDIVLSTDSNEIKQVAEQYNLYTSYDRPAKLASDAAGKVAAIEDVLYYMEKAEDKQYDYVLDLDVTSPLRTINDLQEAFAVIKKDTQALNLFSVSHPNRNPYFNVIELNEAGYAKIVKPMKNPFYSRQSAPKVYDVNGSFYIYRREFFRQKLTSALTDRTIPFLVEHMCFDIDNFHDFIIMDFLIKEDKLDFDL